MGYARPKRLINKKMAARRLNKNQVADARNSVIDYDIDQLIKLHPEPSTWIHHIEADLMNFWYTDEALDRKNGLFRTYRANDGSLIDLDDPEHYPPEIKAALKSKDAKGLIDLDRNYLRMHARQTYAYGMAYHALGIPAYLDLCREGAYAIVGAQDGIHGRHTLQDARTGEWDAKDKYIDRTSQDLAYGMLGVGMYYYLTHDETMLHSILQVKEYIFATYFDKGKGYFTWKPSCLKQPDVDITGQLDQMYAYMMLVTPALPEPYQSEWKQDLKMIVDILIQRFYSERYGFFWGVDSAQVDHQLGRDHTDFGHSVKTFWLIYEVGTYLKDMNYVTFARKHIDHILDEAFIPRVSGSKIPGSWAKRYNEDGNLDKDKEWWQLAELDQACAILSLNDPSYLTYLNETYDYWLQFMVDHDYGEIWHVVDGKTNKPVLEFPKIHMWKNSHHSFEHALFAYMISSQIKHKPFELYYAFDSTDEVTYDRVRPYFFEGNIVSVKVKEKLENDPFHKIIKVRYDSLH